MCTRYKQKCSFGDKDWTPLHGASNQHPFILERRWEGNAALKADKEKRREAFAKKEREEAIREALADQQREEAIREYLANQQLGEGIREYLANPQPEGAAREGT
jgi:hypothetical protein